DTTTGYATLVATFQWGSAGFRGLAVLPQSPCNCPADLVVDGVVDVSDFLLLLSSWGDTSGPADLDGNGIVDISDFLALLAAWGPCE
ncbi:MAG: GC-type dockerin domain-anchored protein, partial [Planctomycetota bacterium]